MLSANQDQYDSFHELYHPVFKSFLKKFGYYDIFLVEPESGIIVYSVFKEADYATSLKTGPYGDTGIATAIKEAMESSRAGSTHLIDYAQYLPSYAAPASFISSPIFENGKETGALIFQMPVDRINQIMTNNQNWANEGLGASGDSGKGFSIVADEIRKLADSTRENSKLIGENIKKSIMTIEEAMVATNDTGEAFQLINSKVDQIAKTFEEIFSDMNELSYTGSQVQGYIDELNQISEAVLKGSSNMKLGADNISANVDNVHKVSASVASGIREIETGIHEISSATADLSNLGQSNKDALEAISCQVDGFRL